MGKQDKNREIEIKTYLGEYWQGPYKTGELKSCIIMARTCLEALELALENEPDTKSRYWYIQEINNKKSGVYPITTKGT